MPHNIIQKPTELADCDRAWYRVGNNLRRLRLLRGVTQAALGNAAGINHASIMRIETGVNRAPTIRTLERLADALGFDPAEFWSPPAVWAQQEISGSNGPAQPMPLEPEDTSVGDDR